MELTLLKRLLLRKKTYVVHNLVPLNFIIKITVHLKKLEKNLEKLRKSALIRHAKNDGNIGFTTRTKFKSSFPEKLTEDFFNENNISFKREERFSRWFVDFLLPGNIVVEIDGKQHLLPERKEKDKIKDEYLKSIGMRVIRIPYRKVDKEFYDQLRNVIDFL